jgi:glutamate/tyrosine decarboxylase-like PLP-dependent enzyme
MDLESWIGSALTGHRRWEASFGPYEAHPSLEVTDEAFGSALEELATRLEDNYPFFHPRYAGQMLKPPHPAAVVGYLAAMLVNPNNHALDGGPATAEMEIEAMEQLARMFRLSDHLGHLTTSGTIANLEALFVARESHTSLGIAFSDHAHYTHARMCHLLGVQAFPVGTDDRGRLDLDQVEALAGAGKIGTVVLTVGSTGLGAVDRVDEALSLRDRYGLRVHVDGAYGGFFAIAGHDAQWAGSLDIDPAPWQAIAGCDSVVVDPHKHGLQPYGCGAVLFADPSVARHYLHDSPYTYYTAERSRHLGEISLECSRAGAAAAAFWLTLKLFPLDAGGLGSILAATRRAALQWAAVVDRSSVLSLYQPPELDIVTYFPQRPSLAEIDAASGRVFDEAMSGPDPVFLSLLRVSAQEMDRRHPELREVPATIEDVRLLRSVLMKPESEAWIVPLLDRIEELAEAPEQEAASKHRRHGSQ